MNAAIDAKSVNSATALRYDEKTIALHWLTAALVVSLWASEQISDWFSKPMRADILSLHVTLGVALMAVLALRIGWRLSGGRRLPDADKGAMELLARGMQHLLYFAVIAAVLLGLSLEWVRADPIWGLFQLPSIAPGDTALRRSIRGYHELSANLVLALSGLHAAAALFHHCVLRDEVLRRMLPGD